MCLAVWLFEIFNQYLDVSYQETSNEYPQPYPATILFFTSISKNEYAFLHTFRVFVRILLLWWIQILIKVYEIPKRQTRFLLCYCIPKFLMNVWRLAVWQVATCLWLIVFDCVWNKKIIKNTLLRQKKWRIVYTKRVIKA